MKMSTSEKEGNLIMNAKEVSEWLRIGRNTLYDYCRRNLIPHRRVGRRILFSRQAMNKWFESRDQEGLL